MILRWLAGLLRHRAGRLAAVTTGVMTAVALVAAIGAFLVSSKATMTDRAVARVAVDWQGQVAPGAGAAQVAATVAGQAGSRRTDVVTFASVPTLAATTAAPGAPATTQTTGAAQVL